MSIDASTRTSMLVTLLALAASMLAPARLDAQPASHLPTDIAALHSATMARMSGPTRLWIVEQGRHISHSYTDHSAARSAIATAIAARFTTASPEDAAGLAHLVLAEAYRAAAEEHRIALEKITAGAGVRSAISNYSAELGQEIARNAGRPASDNCSAESCRRLSRSLGALMTEMRSAGIATITMSPTIATVGDLQLVRDQLAAASKQLAEQARTAEESSSASKRRRDLLREAIAGYLAKVRAIRGSY